MIIARFSAPGRCCEEELQADDSICIEMDNIRAISINGEVNGGMSTFVCGALQSYGDSKDPVYLYINSPGGSVRDGYAIVDQMTSSPFPVYTIIRGQAGSMGAIIAAYGTKGCRFITKRSAAMIHSVLVGGSDYESIEKVMDQLSYIQQEFDRNVVDMAKRMKVGKAKLKELMKGTEWLTPTQAIKIGLVDGFWTKQMEAKVVKDNNRA